MIAALLEKGRLKEPDLLRARRLHAEAGGSLLGLLGRLGLVSERDHAEACAGVLGLRLLSAKQVPDNPPELMEGAQPLSARFLRQFHLCALGESGGRIVVWMADPFDDYACEAVRLATGLQVQPLVGLRSEIDDLIERWHGQGRSAMGAIVESVDGEGADLDDVEHLRDLASEAPVIRLVNLVIQRAVELRASDIHIEPFENRLKVRYRIDGVLNEGESPPANLTAAVISRIKIMARLNIAERRLPQDGRIMLRVQGKELDLRVSTVPTAHGESVVMRLLDRETVVFDFERLGFTGHFLPQFQKVLEQPHGILLVTGPTGSGKTTTLAKLALGERAFGSGTVGVISLDTFRIGAVEQIQTYADLAGFPLEVLSDPAEVPGALRRLRGCDTVLVDTPGRGPRESADELAWRRVLQQLRPDEVHLVLPAGLRFEVAAGLRQFYAPLSPTHLLLTKLDEVPWEEGVAQLADGVGLPTRWVSDGQDVPTDLHEAASRLVRSLSHDRGPWLPARVDAS